MSNIKRMKDKDGNYIYPVTHASAVFDSDGNSLETLLNNSNNSNNGNSNIGNTDNDITPEKFGAKGDGVTDDTDAIIAAIDECMETKRVLTMTGKYNITTDDVLPLISMQGGTLILNGNVVFKDTSDSDVVIKNVSVIDNVNKTADTEKTASVFYGRFHKIEGSVLVDNVTFSSDNGENRTMRNLTIQNATKVRIFNSTFIGTEGGIFVADSSDVIINNVIGKNVENFVRLTRVNNAIVDTAHHLNTKEQQAWWISQNHNKAVSGMDCVLTEGTASGLKLKNIHAEYAHERAIYCQSSNVEACNLYAENTDGMKFVGNPTTHAKNISIKNVVVRITDPDLTKFVAVVTLYWAEDVVVDGAEFVRINTNTSATTNRLLHMDNGVHRVHMSNVYINNMRTNGIISLVATHDGDKTISDLYFNDMTLIDPSDGTLMLLYGEYVGVNGFDVSNITFSKVRITSTSTPGRQLYYRGCKVTNLLFEDVQVISSHGGYPTIMMNGIADINKYGNNTSLMKRCKFDQYTINKTGVFSFYLTFTVAPCQDTEYLFKKISDLSSSYIFAKERYIMNNDVDDLFINSITHYECVLKSGNDKPMVDYELPMLLNDNTYHLRMITSAGLIEVFVFNGEIATVQNTTSDMYINETQDGKIIGLVSKEDANGNKYLAIEGLSANARNMKIICDKI